MARHLFFRAAVYCAIAAVVLACIAVTVRDMRDRRAAPVLVYVPAPVCRATVDGMIGGQVITTTVCEPVE